MFLILLLITIGTIVHLINLNSQYWKKRGVPGPKPAFFLGNMGPSFFLKKSLAQVYGDIYTKFNSIKNTPLIGIHRAVTPTLLICDPDVIRDITVKSFSHFHDNDFHIEKESDPLLGRNPFILRGKEWKTTRVHLTPGFSSGKMKGLYPVVEDNSKKLVKYMEKQPKAINGEGYDAKDLCKRFTLNNVANYAFGLEAKCYEEENSEFKQIADKFLSPAAFQSVKMFLVRLIPALHSFFSIRFTPRDVEAKLTHIVQHILKYREENNIVRNDYLNVLHQLRSSKKEEFSDVDIIAHAAGFFLDGYETSSIAMSFLLFELAANPIAQSKLREEINQAFEEHGENMPYEVLQSLPYLDGVFNEALRMHPPIGYIDRLCTSPYTYNPKENDIIKHPVVIEKGTPIIFPVYGLHRDPKYFENPNTFKPERFVGQNKEKITKYSFLPFGEGPRTCLGKSFASLQVKLGTAYIIRNYEISVNHKTQTPLKYIPLYFITDAEGGLWLDFKKINNNNV